MEGWTAPNQPLFSVFANRYDPVAGPALAAKVQFQADAADPVAQFYAAICEGDLVTVAATASNYTQQLDVPYPSESGYTALIYAIVHDQDAVAETLLRKYDVDPEVPDNVVKYTPLMWAVHMKSVRMTELVVEFGGDPRQEVNGTSAVELVDLDHHSPVYEYFKTHGLLTATKTEDPEIYESHTFGGGDEVDNLTHQIRMQTLGTTNAESDAESEDELDEEAELARNVELVQTPEFQYGRVVPEQYIKFSDSDIPALLDYIFSMRTSSAALQHQAKLPAAVVFQMLRYSHNKVSSRELTEFLFECFVTRLRSVTNTKSGVFNMAMTTASDDHSSAGGAGDIMLLSYWLAALQFLHFYLARSEFYREYPKFLQELVNLTQLLVATLSFLINLRLNLLVDECLLNFTSLVDVSTVLYAKDWNLFKNKPKHTRTYDDILRMLYPPTQQELMKPSPLKYVQVLGALDYVLKLHEVDPLLRHQAFSQVFYYINAVVFNKLISSSKYCSRTKAVQIRLNLSALEDWLRLHNYRNYKPEILGGISQLLAPEAAPIMNLLNDSGDAKDPHNLSFYYRSLYHIGRNQLMPLIELLQWLQVMSGLQNEEEFVNTINEFEDLNYYQLFKITNKLYRYEVDELRLPKTLNQYLKRLMNEQGEAQVERSILHYMTQSTFLSKEVYIYLNPNHVFGIALPNLTELIAHFGAGIGGVRVMRARKYQPSLPVTVMDDVEEILAANRNANLNDTYDYEEEEDEEEVEEEDEHEPRNDANDDVLKDKDAAAEQSEKHEPSAHFKGDELFKQMQLPLSVAHKHWGDTEMEANPW